MNSEIQLLWQLISSMKAKSIVHSDTMDIGMFCEIQFELQFNLRYAWKMNCALMFIISNHYGIKCLSNLLQSEPCNWYVWFLT